MGSVFSNLSKVINCIELPYAIYLVVATFFVIKKKFVVLLIIFAILWRHLYNISASRYYASLLLLCIIVYAISLSNDLAKKHLKCTIIIFTVLFLSYNIVDTFYSFKDNYIYDVNESIRLFDYNTPNAITWIDSKEYKRVSHDIDKKRVKEIMYTINDSLKQSLNWGGDVYFVSNTFFEYNNIRFNNKILKSNLLCSFKTNKQNKRIYIYKIKLKDCSDKFVLCDTNYINNGDFEVVALEKEKDRMLGRWLGAKDCFYSSKEYLWPKLDYLLPTWDKFNQYNVPRVNLISNDQIDGNYSLKINAIKKCYLYLCNKFEISEGIFSIIIRNIGNDAILSISKCDYETKEDSLPVAPEKEYNLVYLAQNEEKLISIYVDNSVIHGNFSLFFITGESFDIIIDNISFYRTTEFQEE